LYTARLLADLEDYFGAPAGTRFDLIAGTSVGGILALALAYELPAQKIVTLFEKHGREIFKKRAPFGYLKAMYSAEPLRALLSDSDFFGQRTLADCRHPHIIPSINFTTGKPVIFKTPHNPKLVRDHERLAVDVALATSAAPLYFPRHMILSSQYVDGGLFANAPGFLAVHEAEFFLDQRPADVHLMALGTMSAAFTVDPRRNRKGGMLSWGGWNPVNTQKQLFGLAISSQETLIDFVLGHRLGRRYLHVDDELRDEQARSVALDKATPQASEVLIGRAHERVKWLLGSEPRCSEFFAHQPSPPKFYHRP
jgi:predicted acylesterase/phospholipase RssA